MEFVSQKPWKNVTGGLKVPRIWTVRREVSRLHIPALDAGTEVPKNPFHSSRRRKSYPALFIHLNSHYFIKVLYFEFSKSLLTAF